MIRSAIKLQINRQGMRKLKIVNNIIIWLHKEGPKVTINKGKFTELIRIIIH